MQFELVEVSAISLGLGQLFGNNFLNNCQLLEEAE